MVIPTIDLEKDKWSIKCDTNKASIRTYNTLLFPFQPFISKINLLTIKVSSSNSGWEIIRLDHYQCLRRFYLASQFDLFSLWKKKSSFIRLPGIISIKWNKLLCGHCLSVIKGLFVVRTHVTRRLIRQPYNNITKQFTRYILGIENVKCAVARKATSSLPII